MPRRNVPCKARPEALLLGGLATHSPLSQPETDTRRRRRPTRRVSLGRTVYLDASRPHTVPIAPTALDPDLSGSNVARATQKLRLFERRQNKHTTRPPHPVPVGRRRRKPSVRPLHARGTRATSREGTNSTCIRGHASEDEQNARTQNTEHRTTTCA